MKREKMSYFNEFGLYNFVGRYLGWPSKTIKHFQIPAKLMSDVLSHNPEIQPGQAFSKNTDTGLFVDLSHTIENGLITYKGLPAPIICDYLSREDSKKFYEAGTEFQIGKIEMVANTGTYIDCPFHRFAHGKDFTQIGLECFADLEGILISIPYSKSLAITEKHLENYELGNKAVLIHTGWDLHWNTDQYYEKHPYLTRGAAEYLVSNNVKLVGIDSHNIDDTSGNGRPVHTILLGANILIVEHLCNLNTLPPKDFTFSAVPPKFKGVGTFPVRAMAKLKI